jgi:DNA-binding LacI/PurR family transcriptional regulator/anti-anti-sigma regulatory factor
MQQPQPLTIGFLGQYITGFYFGAILNGVHRAARKRGVRLFVAQRQVGAAYSLEIARDLVDGWVVMHETPGGRQLVGTGVPTVTISQIMPPAPAVMPDNRNGMQAVVRHLIEHGHRRIAFVGAIISSDFRERFEGYSAALAEAGLPLDPQIVLDVEGGLEPGGQIAARQLIELGMPCTAIAAATDMTAIGMIEVLRSEGYRVPEDLAIVGFDDALQAQVHDPPLTTVRQRFDSVGARAAHELVDILEGKPAPQGPVYVETMLVTRRSCGCSEQMWQQTEVNQAEIVADDWKERLRERVLRLLLYPADPGPAGPSPTLWPSLGALIDVLDLVAQGGEPPKARIFEPFWNEALTVTVDITALNNVFTLLEDAVWKRMLAAPRPEGTELRLTRMVGVVRGALLRACVGAEARQTQYLDGVLNANSQISSTLLGSGANHAPDLEWLRSTSTEWGYLGLWSKDDMSALTVTSSYSRLGSHPNLDSREFATSAFPPPSLVVDTAREGELPAIVMLPVRSTRREWGVLVLGGPFHAQVNASANPTGIWAEMLGTELDRAQLLAELNQQQTTLQLAYDRERALANTIRELGCPIIPMLPGVLLIPLIGAIDSDRANLIIQAVLEEVSRSRATEVLIDVTGVPIVDTQVANALIQMARMNSLLGARSTLVGVRPEIAQSIVGLGVSLSGIQSSTTLAAALYALRRTTAVPKVEDSGDLKHPTAASNRDKMTR